MGATASMASGPLETTSDRMSTVTNAPYVNRMLLKHALDIIKRHGENSAEISQFMYKHRADRRLIDLIRASQIIKAKLRDIQIK